MYPHYYFRSVSQIRHSDVLLSWIIICGMLEIKFDVSIHDFCDSLSLIGSSLEIAYTNLSSVSSYNIDKTNRYQASASPSHYYKTRLNNQVANSRDIAHEKFVLEGAELQESSLHRQVSFLPLLIHGMCPSLTL